MPNSESDCYGKLSEAWDSREERYLQLAHWLDPESTGTLIVDGAYPEPGVCGDVVLGAGENCDDGNLGNGDGCSASCEIEPGFTCINDFGSPSVCILPTVRCNNTQVAIPDDTPSGIGTSLTMPAGTLFDLNVILTVDHTWIGDLEAILTHENTGTYSMLFPNSGCSNPDIDAIFDDEGQAPNTLCSFPPPAMGGSVTPLASLDRFDGENAEGTWTLRIGDNASFDTGTLISWCLSSIQYDVDSDFDGVSDAIDNCLYVANTAQVDADGDGYGNLCDADFNNDCVINISDLGVLRQNFFSSNPVTDINGDGTTNVVDLGVLRTLFFDSPGPSLLGNCP